jgi:hypothetical protein
MAHYQPEPGAKAGSVEPAAAEAVTA